MISLDDIVENSVVAEVGQTPSPRARVPHIPTSLGPLAGLSGLRGKVRRLRPCIGMLPMPPDAGIERSGTYSLENCGGDDAAAANGTPGPYEDSG